MLRYFLLILVSNCAFGYQFEWNHSNKIVGGNEIDITEAPYHASYYVERDLPGRFYFTCGVTIIRSTVVLTSAQCVKLYTGLNATVVAGMSSFGDGDYKIAEISRIVIHEGFSEETLDNDIALAFLYRILVTTDRIRPISVLPQGAEVNATSEHVAVGFGGFVEGSIFNSELKQVKMPIVAQDQCRSIYSNIKDVTPNMFCAGYLGRNDSGICDGDFGGSLVADGYIVGITSWSIGCARPEYPAVFVKVSMYREWIDEKIRG